MAIAFYISVFILLYAYVGYGVLLWLISRLKRSMLAPAGTAELPAVTLIIPAYNEADCLHGKLQNCLELDYPADKLRLVVVTDGSTDESETILQQFHQRITWLHQSTRQGKMAAINRSMQYVETPIVVFSDANTMLNQQAISQLVKHYADPHVGGVAGEKKVVLKNNGAIGLGEGLYWQYESRMKQLDSNFNTVVGAAGELFSMRTSLFVPQDEQLLLDDFMLSMKLCIDGYRVVYEPGAFATEVASINLEEEKKRRIRIAAGAFQSVTRLWPYLLIVKHPLLYFQYFSRRILRWIACPISLLVCFVANAYLVWQPGAHWGIQAFFVLQLLLYTAALLGGIGYRKGVVTLFFIPFYFLFMHVSLVWGWIHYITNRQSVLWDKSKRHIAIETVN